MQDSTNTQPHFTPCNSDVELRNAITNAYWCQVEMYNGKATPTAMQDAFRKAAFTYDHGVYL